MRNSFFVSLVATIVLLLPQTYAQDNNKTTMTATKKADRVSTFRTVSATLADLTTTIEYSAPAVKGRTIWGELVPYGKVWRTGANEATTIEFNRDVFINGVRVRAGKYALFSIPDADKWVFILNTVPDQWGAFKYDESKDALRFSVTPQNAPAFSERLTFETKAIEADKTILVSLIWENKMLSWEVK